MALKVQGHDFVSFILRPDISEIGMSYETYAWYCPDMDMPLKGQSLETGLRGRTVAD